MSKLRIANFVLLLVISYMFLEHSWEHTIEMKAQDDSEIYEHIQKAYPRLREFEIIKSSKGIKAVIVKY